MTPLTAEKIAELEIQISEALDYSRNFAAAKPNIGRTEREHIEGLCDLLERSSVELLSLAKRVAGAPVVRFNDDGSLDEVVGFGEFHLEQMSGTNWWMQLGPHMVNLTARGKIGAHFGRNEAVGVVARAVNATAVEVRETANSESQGSLVEIVGGEE
jgi:hypothetical protein